MVQVEDLHKSFTVKKQVKQVLKGVSFTAGEGKIYGLLGPNGAGKTTTLRTIATLLKPDSGRVLVGGRESTRESQAIRNSIGFLTGEMRLSGTLSSRETLVFFGRLSHMDRELIEKRITFLSEYLEMKDFLDRPIEKLSSGMKQKTSIAVSLVHDPEVIIFDEPTSNLDILAVKVVIDFLNDARTSGKTVILSTHVLSEAEKLCDEIGILLGGKLLLDGKLPEILESYKTDRLEDVFFHLAKQQGVIA